MVTYIGHYFGLTANRRYSNIEANELYSLATLLDPRYKDKIFSTRDLKSQAVARLQDLVSEETAAQREDDSELEPTAKRPRMEAVPTSFLSRLKSKISSDPPTVTESPSSYAQTMVNEYLNDSGLLDPSDNPLLYWKLRSSKWPVLASLARKYLSAPCSSVPSERAFKGASHVISQKRVRILPENAETLLFLKFNMKLASGDALTRSLPVPTAEELDAMFTQEIDTESEIDADDTESTSESGAETEPESNADEPIEPANTSNVSTADNSTIDESDSSSINY